MAIPGLKVVAPSTPADMMGLMAAAIRDPDPVIFCEHKALFATKGEVPGRRARRAARRGARSSARAPTARSWRSRRWSRGPLEAAERLQADHGISAEVIDLRSPGPARRPGRPAHRSRRRAASSPSRRTRGLCGWGAEIVSIVADEGFYSLDAPLVRITTPHVPLPSAPDARGRRDPVRRPDRRHRPPPARGGEVSRDDDASRSSAPGRMGSAMARALARAGHDVILQNRTPIGCEALAGEIGGRGRRHARGGRGRRRRHDHDARRRRGGPRGLRRPGRPRRGRPRGRRARRHEHGPRRRRSARSREPSRARGVGPPRRAGERAASRWPRRGELTLMVGGDGRRTSSGPGRSSSASRRRSSTSARSAPAPR